MGRPWSRVLVILCSITAVGCGGDGDNGFAATLVACQTYCDTVVAKSCDLPLYATVSECTMAECSDLKGAPAKCQPPLKAYYTCESTQSDICEDNGCAAPLEAVIACAS